MVCCGESPSTLGSIGSNAGGGGPPPPTHWPENRDFSLIQLPVDMRPVLEF